MTDILIVTGGDTYILRRDQRGDLAIPSGFTDDDVEIVTTAIEPLMPDAEVRLIDEVALRRLEERHRAQVYEFRERPLHLKREEYHRMEPVVLREERPFNDHPRSPRETRRSQRNGRRR